MTLEKLAKPPSLPCETAASDQPGMRGVAERPAMPNKRRRLLQCVVLGLASEHHSNFLPHPSPPAVHSQCRRQCKHLMAGLLLLLLLVPL